MNKNQKGFALIESLLIILILAVVGFGGYYVWNTQHDKTKAANSPKSSTPASTSPSSTSPSYFTIKEWGVRAPFSASLTPEYSISNQSGSTWAYFSSKELNLSDSNCTTNGGYGGIINRIAAGQQIMGPTGESSNQTIEAAISSGVIKDYSHVGNFYYYYEHPQAACGQSEYSQTIQTETETAVEDIAKSLQPTQN